MIKVLKYDPYLQTDEFISWLESKALEGWYIVGLNQDNLWVKFRKGEPKRVRYSIFTIENSKLFNRDEFLEIAKAQGWKLVGNQVYLRELYLFVSEEESPIPLETDPVELDHKNQKLKRYALWSLGLSIFIIMIYLLPLGQGARFQWIPAMAYGYLALMHVVQALRTGSALNKSKERRDFVARSVVTIRIAMVGGLMLLLLGLSIQFLHLMQIKVEVNPLVHWEAASQMEVVNESYTVSRFSFIPNATSMITIVEKDHLTRSIYQSKQSFLWLSDTSFHEEVDNELDWYKYDRYLKYELVNEVSLYRVVFQSKNEMEFWSFVKRGNTILSLHTINLSQEEHETLLERMEAEA